METTYTIEFMRLAEPPLAPIKQPSGFHVAYYGTQCVPLITTLHPCVESDILPGCSLPAG
jgi:hypothetical protein